ncbi:hypothetical protein UY3_11420 [Chelonia mydas]|uniref:Uncharacterized protein n=1 Tax=Chelonia mydas TaxID=8469 RepID=M7B0W4_CHEMY|nr:hypothetical protein UY3_11420 [Chelonia mydas]
MGVVVRCAEPPAHPLHQTGAAPGLLLVTIIIFVNIQGTIERPNVKFQIFSLILLYSENEGKIPEVSKLALSDLRSLTTILKSEDERQILRSLCRSQYHINNCKNTSPVDIAAASCRGGLTMLTGEALPSV